MQKNPVKTIIAVDPSICKLGWAIVSGSEPLEIIETGVIKTKEKGHARIFEIAIAFQEILRNHTEVEALIIETQFIHGMRGNAVLKTTEVKGVIEGMFIAEDGSSDAEIFEVNPAQVKKAAGVTTRMKRAESKLFVSKMVRKFFNNEMLGEDECDALAMALVYFNHQLLCKP